ncbi:MAG: hypothetical protein WC979_00050 [Candidatus Pacearchaeota archaeon]|jgi:hypothetical protein|nr:hypothetical protein [Clostridia bacterium]
MKNSKKIQSKIAKQNQTVADSFEFPVGKMKCGNSKGYKDHFGRAVSEFEHTLRSNKAEVARRTEESRIKSLDEQIADQKKYNESIAAKNAENKLKNSADYKLAQRNANFVTKEAVEYKLAQRGLKHIVDEKGNVVLTKITPVK